MTQPHGQPTPFPPAASVLPRRRLARAARTSLALSLLLAPLGAWAQDALPVAASLLPQDLSPWGMVAGADWVVQSVLAGAGRTMGRGAGVLATIGATAPFVGLFGTVWGIMNAFIGLSRAQTTNLAVVAPGIAEALLATWTAAPGRLRAVGTSRGHQAGRGRRRAGGGARDQRHAVHRRDAGAADHLHGGGAAGHRGRGPGATDPSRDRSTV